MEQEFTVMEIVNDRSIRKPEKVRMLYLHHKKSYEEIAELLGMKVSTVRWHISNGGYCIRKPGKHGDVRSIIKKMYEENPNVTALQIADKIGCSLTNVYIHAKELGIVFKRNKICSQQTATYKYIYPAPKENTELKASKLPEPKPKITYTPDEGPPIVKSKESSNESSNDKDTGKHMGVKDVKSESIASESATQSVDVKSPEIRESETIAKPYEVLEWPMVYYNGHICEVLSRKRLRRELRMDLNIKSVPKKKKKSKKEV